MKEYSEYNSKYFKISAFIIIMTSILEMIALPIGMILSLSNVIDTSTRNLIFAIILISSCSLTVFGLLILIIGFLLNRKKGEKY